MRVYDQVAAVVKSGGKTRRAAKMQSLKVTHPDIMEFIECKSKEENKARVHSDVEAVLPAHGQGAMELMAAPSSFGLSLVEARQSWVSKATTRVYQHLSSVPRSHGNLAVGESGVNGHSQ
jgi:ribonucleoside-diphosphate reductase alpha chain